MSATTSSQPDIQESLVSSSCNSASGEKGTLPCDARDPSGPSQAHPDKPPPSRRKQPMKDFEWGANIVRKALPVQILPRWLDPGHVDVADPTKLPLCWYGVPLVRKLVYAYAERMGIASYYREALLRAKAGDLDTFQTWANFDKWFKKVSGLQLDLNLVWGQPTPILTFFSNHELPRITKDQLELILDLLEDMDYGEEYQLMWYLDRKLAY